MWMERLTVIQKVKIVFGRNDYLTLQNCNVK